MNARRAAVALGLAASLLPAVPAGAHGSVDPRRAPVLDRVDPQLPGGVVVQVRFSVSAQLVADNPTPTVLAVLDSDGREFLRLSQAGVFADFASPAWWDSLSPEGAPIPAPGVADWRLVTKTTSWGWFDHRLHPPRGDVWAVPMRYGGQAAEAHGRIITQTLGSFVPRFTAQLPDGVKADLLPGKVPGVSLQATVPVTVLGTAGEPFARLAGGRVEFNALSPTYVDEQRLRGWSPDGTAADPAAKPRWVGGPGTMLAWLDQRLAFPAGPPPDRAKEVRWTVPVEVDGRRTELAGVTAWQPAGPGGRTSSGGSGGGAAVPILVVLLAGGAVGGIVLWRRAAVTGR